VINSTELSDRRINDFRRGLYRCFDQRSDALFCVVDSLLSEPEVCCVAHLSLASGCPQGYGALYAGLGRGEINEARLTTLLVSVGQDCPEIYNVDCTTWARPQARTSPERVMCYSAKGSGAKGSGAKGSGAKGDGGASPSVPGWNVSVIVRQTSEADSWVVPVSAEFVGPTDKTEEVTLHQIEEIALADAESTGRPLFVLDSGYSGPSLTRNLRLRQINADVLVRVRTGRVFYAPAPPVEHRGRGRVRVHGARLVLANPETAPTMRTVTYAGDREVVLEAWSNQHAKSNFGDHDVTGAWVVRASPTGSAHKPLWLFYSGPETEPDLARLYYAYLRRFDIEHFFRFTKQRLGLTRVALRSPQAALRWVRLVMAAYAQLVLAKARAFDLRLPWEKVLETSCLTPRRVLRAFTQRWRDHWSPPSSSQIHRGGPGRALGTKNRRAQRERVTMKSRTKRF
jgi:hypothetical protein